MLTGLMITYGNVEAPDSHTVEQSRFCRANGSVPYYSFPLITTKNVAGTGRGNGTVEVTFLEESPFGVSVTDDGSYSYHLDVSLDKINIRRTGELVVWVTTRDLSEIQPIGILGKDQRIQGFVDWNKFLIVVTLEQDSRELGERWQGPVVLRGMSRSGMMHTMVGHGILQEENCFAYGYDG